MLKYLSVSFNISTCSHAPLTPAASSFPSCCQIVMRLGHPLQLVVSGAAVEEEANCGEAEDGAHITRNGASALITPTNVEDIHGSNTSPEKINDGERDALVKPIRPSDSGESSTVTPTATDSPTVSNKAQPKDRAGQLGEKLAARKSSPEDDMLRTSGTIQRHGGGNARLPVSNAPQAQSQSTTSLGCVAPPIEPKVPVAAPAAKGSGAMPRERRPMILEKTSPYLLFEQAIRVDMIDKFGGKDALKEYLRENNHDEVTHCGCCCPRMPFVIDVSRSIIAIDMPCLVVGAC